VGFSYPVLPGGKKSIDTGENGRPLNGSRFDAPPGAKVIVWAELSTGQRGVVHRGDVYKMYV